ncbi:lipopolysaccharide transport system ATP-binding protein [Methylobacterium sp. 174MFSha1.1]|nr:lipopolysaccharide transport system ATP-binding protein [Methylobacterium sp. 174MFSha1.1]
MIRAEGLGKRYRVGRGGRQYTALRDVMTEGTRRLAGRILGRGPARGAEADDAFWALRGVDFAIRRGEVVGLVGRNGAGKSTLLKVLSRITEPTEGRVTIKGRVASLLEVGTGFHPELTGRENIFLNGAILGMSRSEIRRKFDEIVAFAETERFLDLPVKRYSSGMYVRLAFAVAAHLEAEILIVDEVLAVGDAEFQARCLGKLGQVAGDGRTVLFVSHNLAAVERLCSAALLLDRGRVVAQGTAGAIARRYLDEAVVSSGRGAARRIDHTGEALRIDRVDLLVNGSEARHAVAGDACEIAIAYSCLAAGGLRRPPSFTLEVHLNGQKVALLWSEYRQDRPTLPDSGTVRCLIPRWPFRDGVVRLDVAAHVGTGLQDRFTEILTFQSLDGPYYGSGPMNDPDRSLVFLDHDWA